MTKITDRVPLEFRKALKSAHEDSGLSAALEELASELEGLETREMTRDRYYDPMVNSELITMTQRGPEGSIYMEKEWSKDLLDHGYIKIIETWGSDARIIEAARMSTDSGFKGWGCGYCEGDSPLTHKVLDPLDGAVEVEPYTCPECGGKGVQRPGDEKLLAYLYNNKHMTPFEMGGMVIEVQAPIFVIREWERHHTQSYNEMSARYTPLPDLYYIPTLERVMMNSKDGNKQAGTVKGSDELTEDNARRFLSNLEGMYSDFQDVYDWSLSVGIPKELARCAMPVGHYSRMRASTNLRNWLGFMTLRSAPNAQWEIRQYSNALNGMLSEAFPRTMELFNG